MRRIITAGVLLAGAIALALVLLGLSRGPDSSPYFGKATTARAGRLVYNLQIEPATLDPQLAGENYSSLVAEAMFEGLTEYHPQTLEPIAALATHYEANADSSQFTFYLRGHKAPKGIRLPNRDDLRRQHTAGQLAEDFARSHPTPPDDVPARWSDGAVITAHDFVYSWRRAVDPATAAQNAFLLFAIKNGQNIATRRRFRDKQTGQLVRGTLGPDGSIAEDPAAPPISATPGGMRRTPERFTRLLERADPVPYSLEELGVRALDDFTFQVDLTQPTAFFLKMTPIAIFRAVPRQVVEPARARARRNEGSESDWLKPQNIVVGGAFKLTARMPYDHIMLARNPNYWDAAAVALQEVKLLPIEDRVTGMGLYKSGEVDLCVGGAVPQPFLRTLRASKRDFFTGPATILTFYIFNTTKKPFDDARVRRALDMAVDKEGIAEFQGNGQVPQWRLTPPFPGYSPRAASRYDPEEARRLLAQAGYPGGVGPDGQRLRCAISFNTDEGIKRLAELLQANWERNLGIAVELQNREARVHQQTLLRLEYEGVAFLSFSADYMDPNTYLELFLSDSQINGGWKDAKYDDLLHRANAEADAARRMELLAQAEDYLVEHQPFLPLYVGVWSYVKKPYVRGVAHNLFDKHPLKFAWLEQGIEN